MHVIEDGSDTVVGALLAQGLMVSSRSTEACFVFGGPEVTNAAEKLGCASRVLDAEVDGWEHYLVEGGASGLGALPTGSRVIPAIGNTVRSSFDETCDVGGTAPGCGCVAGETGETVKNLFDKTPADCNIGVVGADDRARDQTPSGWIAGSSKDGVTGTVMAVLWNGNTAPVSLGVAGDSLGVGDAGGTPHAVGVYANGALSRAFLWRGGKLTDLGAVGGSNVSARANAVSNTGFVAGSSDGGTIPVRWRYDVTNAGSNPALERLPLPTDLALPSPVAVNAGGDVVGSAWTSSFARTRAVLWRNGEAINLGTWPGGLNSRAFVINDAGQIVGEGRMSAKKNRFLPG